MMIIIIILIIIIVFGEIEQTVVVPLSITRKKPSFRTVDFSVCHVARRGHISLQKDGQY